MTQDTDQLSALIDGELSKADAVKLKVALEENPDLADTLARLTRNDVLIRAAVPLEDPLPAALLERLGLCEAKSNVVDLAEVRSARSASAQTRRNGFGGWQRFAAMAATVCVVAFGISQYTRQVPQVDQAPYRTLSSAPQLDMVQPNMVVVFTGSRSASDVNALIGGYGGKIVGSPTSAGAWKVSVPLAERDALLAHLRTETGVSLAEAIDGGTP